METYPARPPHDTATAPVGLVATYRVRPGRADELAALCQHYATTVRSAEPTAAGLGFYLDPHGDELTLVQLHRGGRDLDSHLALMGSVIAAAAELADPLAVQVWGTPGPALKDAVRLLQQSGARVTVTPHAVAGFARTADRR